MGMIKDQHKKMIKTTDDFYPNYPNDEVEVQLVLYYFHSMVSKLTVFGMDDYGLEIEGDAEDYSRLKDLYDNMLEPITIDWLTENGFTQF